MEYALVKGGSVVNCIVADQEFIDGIAAEYDHIEALDTLYEQGLGVGIGWTWDVTNGFTPPPTPEPTPVPRKHILTKLEYMQRFTKAELAGIYTAAKTVVDIEVWLDMFKVSTEIDIDDQDTKDGLAALEAAGLLGTGRAAEITA